MSAFYICEGSLSSLCVFMFQRKLSEEKRTPVSWYLGQKKVELLTEAQMEQDNLYCVDQSVRRDTLGLFFFLLKGRLVVFSH